MRYSVDVETRFRIGFSASRTWQVAVGAVRRVTPLAAGNAFRVGAAETDPHGPGASALRTISDRLSEASLRSFVGRGAEIDLIAASACGPDPDAFVVFIHGTAGIGKTSLLAQAADAIGPAACVLRLDCRD